jgi:polyhydroxyalkanoic acid synthase PhaR subunit
MAEQTDPFAVWREWVSQSERQWNSFLNETMASEAYGQAMGRFMEMYLAMQKGMTDALGRHITSLNLPARSDVLALGDRLAAIEDRLASIAHRLERLAPDSREAGGLPTSVSEGLVEPVRPPRTRKPVTP